VGHVRPSPAVGGLDATHQSTQHDGGAGPRPPEHDDKPPPLGAPAQLAVGCPRIVRFAGPALARLNRRRLASRSDLAAASRSARTHRWPTAAAAHGEPGRLPRLLAVSAGLPRLESQSKAATLDAIGGLAPA
jgi:hypothetical protein